MVAAKEKTWVINSILWWNQMAQKWSNAQIRQGAANAIFVNAIRNWPRIWLSTRTNGMNLSTLSKADSVAKQHVSRRNRLLNFKNVAAIDLIFLQINQEKIISAAKVQKRSHLEPVAQIKWKKSKLKIFGSESKIPRKKLHWSKLKFCVFGFDHPLYDANVNRWETSERFF